MHDLSPQQIIALTALLSGKTVPESAQAAGVDPTTVRRWLKQDGFSAEYAEGKREALWRAMNVLADATHIAATTVIGVMKNPRVHPHVRLAAAKIVIDNMTRWAELQDLDERLKRLEEQRANVS